MVVVVEGGGWGALISRQYGTLSEWNNIWQLPKIPSIEAIVYPEWSGIFFSIDWVEKKNTFLMTVPCNVFVYIKANSHDLYSSSKSDSTQTHCRVWRDTNDLFKWCIQNYIINHHTWHSPQGFFQCHVIYKKSQGSREADQNALWFTFFSGLTNHSTVPWSHFRTDKSVHIF